MVGEAGFEGRWVSLRDGRRVWLRAGGPGDAPAFRDYLVRAVPSADGVGLYADEIGSVDSCRERLERSLPGPAGRGGLLVFAEPEGEPGLIVGDCALTGFGRRKLDGVLVLGMMCDLGWRGVGLGRALLTGAVEWARASPSARRVELGVLSTNPGAMALYRSVGFEVEGRFRGRFRQADGSLVDDFAMALAGG